MAFFFNVSMVHGFVHIKKQVLENCFFVDILHSYFYHS